MSLIYTPKGKALEYAKLALNIFKGCPHGCTYCYAPNALHMSRTEFHFAVRPRRDTFLRDLEREAGKLKPSDPILLCFSCDPYPPSDPQQLTRETIKILHAAGHHVTVLTKGGTRALRDLDLFTPRDAFATTLTLLDLRLSRVWEPGAAWPSDRIATIAEFHRAGIPTWVSLEPVLNPDLAMAIIRQTHKFVDLYKVGRWNYDPRANQIDWQKFAADAVTLLQSLGKAYLIKKDLACFLPPGLPAAWRPQ